MIRELLAQAGVKEMAITAFGGGRMVLAEPNSVEFDMGKRFLLQEQSAAVFCQLMTCQKGGMAGTFVREKECSGLPERLTPKRIEPMLGKGHVHHYSCLGCMFLKK